MNANDWDPWRSERWDPKYGPLPIYGRAAKDGPQRMVQVSLHGWAVEDRPPTVGAGTKRKNLRRAHRRSGTSLSFREWLKQRSPARAA